jgi:hypothetical protein
MILTELETSARTENKRMTNHNTPQISRMDLPIHCAAFPVLSLLNTWTVQSFRLQISTGSGKVATTVRERGKCHAVLLLGPAIAKDTDCPSGDVPFRTKRKH